ncbi:E1-E2 ATPase-domain-containing protein [Paecilomyces variotii]|uniref:E1-E2 ATPase-domain-containing protein n=1 Tax=Byssochlamys spectabilis TaxID=264951 RepID=A0A443HP32_BYSSP|nr:E1-E2 ATPase-domain-containing protein [Paecilomyces variotii]RWQ93547.1 E1-E2 ATPase-domain-containing protein [Paecilomyces variotii]
MLIGSHRRDISDKGTLTTVLLVNNVHCASCVAYVEEVLSGMSSIKNVDVSILTHEVRVRHGSTTGASDLPMALIHAAFEVHHATTYDQEGRPISDIDTSDWDTTRPRTPRRPSSWIPSNPSTRPEQPRAKSRQTIHIENCEACRKEELGKSIHPSQSLGALDTKKRALDDGTIPLFCHQSLSSCEKETEDLLSPVETSTSHLTEAAEEYEARLSIGGMTCASCSNAVTSEVQQLDCVKSVTVNLLTNSATLAFTGPKENIDKIIEQIEDIGYEASLYELHAKRRPSPEESGKEPTTYMAEISIGGMTCGSCVGAVTRGLEELPFVKSVAVDLLSNSGKVEFEGRDNLDKISEKVDDLGYDCSVVNCHPVDPNGDETTEVSTTRTVMIRVDGLFCHHCPEKVAESLEVFRGDTFDFEIEQMLSLNDPILKITYTPAPPTLTIRSILSAIQEANQAFTPSIYHPPSIEDRSRAMQLHERRRLLSRVFFVFLVTIPTFLIGIVFMSLVAPTNPIRRYLEEPMWAGRVSRNEWALFIMTTPVMFYGTDVFHVRAMKEIRALWRPGSRVPILRRFYRFGSMNLLICAGTMVAYISSLAVLIIDAVVNTPSSRQSSTYFDSVVFLTLFILAGRFLEAYSKVKTGDAVASLGKLRPSEALLITDNTDRSDNQAENPQGRKMQRVSVDLLEVGDRVNVPHGASPPADGTVVGSGSYRFDESSLTGESRPVHKAEGDKVYAGSVNLGQPVSVVVTELGGTSMLDQIVAVVREGQSKRAPLERVADILTGYFVPVITLIAILTFIIWLSLGESGVLPADYLDVAQGGWAFWSLEFAISVFVVACPCGLALAAPTALFVGGGLAARHGILVRGGGEAFQEASRLDAIVFDKTGTLTEGGSLKVSDHEVLVTDTEDEQVAWALTRELEDSSNHPIARAISELCSTKARISIISSDIHEISGQGMKGIFTVSVAGATKQNKYEAAIGNERLLKSLPSSHTDTYYLENLLSRYQSAGKSTAILSLRKISDAEPDTTFTPAIVFATSDPIRADAVEVISQLQERHINVFMCTGDNQTTAHAVAATLGIPRENVMANVMPNQKADFIRGIQQGGSQDDAEGTFQNTKQSKRTIVAFVGDGTNDSPALAAADVSIAMASGSDVAINSASFILLNSELTTILKLVTLSRRVFRRVKMNFGWAAIYNVSLVPIAAGVLYPIVSGTKYEMLNGKMTLVNEHWRFSPAWAALAMALSSVSVVCSSLALRIEGKNIRKFFGMTD